MLPSKEQSTLHRLGKLKDNRMNYRKNYLKLWKKNVTQNSLPTENSYKNEAKIKIFEIKRITIKWDVELYAELYVEL